MYSLLLSPGLLRWMRSGLTGISCFLLCLSLIKEIPRAFFSLTPIVSHITEHKPEPLSRSFQSYSQIVFGVPSLLKCFTCNNKYKLQRWKQLVSFMKCFVHCFLLKCVLKHSKSMSLMQNLACESFRINLSGEKHKTNPPF